VQKGHHPILFRTLFGKRTLNSLRLHNCACQPMPSKTFSRLADLLPERTAPELLYLEAKWCTPMSFGMTFFLVFHDLLMNVQNQEFRRLQYPFLYWLPGPVIKAAAAAEAEQWIP